MGAKASRAAILLYLAFSASAFTADIPDILPGESNGQIEEAYIDTGSVGYRYEMDENGNPVYTQTLSWEGDPYALEYEITVLDAAGAELSRTRQAGTALSLRLSPGDYSYNIVTINLLGQAEAETGFRNLSIIRAEVPEIKDTSPGFIFMDSFNALVTVKGLRIQEGARILLRKKDSKPGRGIVGIETARVGESEVTVRFPEAAYAPGTFNLSVVNPGGLYVDRPQAIRILYQRPVDILVSAGYAPVFLAGDSWQTEVWSDQTFYLGADTALSVYFLKKAWGFLGLGIDASAHRLDGGLATSRIESTYALSNLSVLYKYRLSRIFHAQARVGGGVSVSTHSFDYSGNPGPEDSFSSPCLIGGLGLQAFLPRKFFLEFGVDWVKVVQGESAADFIRPSVRAGYRLF